MKLYGGEIIMIWPWEKEIPEEDTTGPRWN